MSSANNIVNIKSTKNNRKNSSQKFSSSITKKVVDLTNDEAKGFFLKSESYCNIELPPYFQFDQILTDIDKELNGKRLSDLRKGSPRDYNDLNYKILNNKDGRYSWRPLQLIHPVLYVSLIHKITAKENWKTIIDRYNDLTRNPKIECISIPLTSYSNNSNKAEQINHWWNNIEQKSIELALDFDHLTHTDITDCYGAIYTHTVTWALHGKDVMKNKENKNNPSFIGNIIDTHLQDMSHGQTNGIPQGSILMDFIAEIILGYGDMLLTEKISNNINDYKILRYRDDYRIFVNNPRDGEKIVKYLTEVMIDLGLKLSAEKTKSTHDVVKGSIKSDKIFWMKQKQTERSLQKHFLIIHNLSLEYPNSGSLVTALRAYYKSLLKVANLNSSSITLISIAVDIAYKNPRTYPQIAQIISFLLTSVTPEDKKITIIDKIRKKLSNIPNTGHLDIWLQRITLGLKKKYDYDEPLCQVASGIIINIWNTEWLEGKLKKSLDSKKIINKKDIDNLSVVIKEEEVDLFYTHSL